jgi:hypothetical protein
MVKGHMRSIVAKLNANRATMSATVVSDHSVAMFQEEHHPNGQPLVSLH